MEDDENPVCAHCGEEPYCEEEWHLKLYTACANGCCVPEWYHVTCFNKFGQCPLERYEGPMCVFCDEGPYLEEVWHLQKIGCCSQGVYHPACTVNLLKEVWGTLYWDIIRCPHCNVDASTYKLSRALVGNA
jgi:hypothetical protein